MILLSLLLGVVSAHAAPDVDLPIAVPGTTIVVYRDHDQSDHYWYMPTKVAEAPQGSSPSSVLNESAGRLEFRFYGMSDVSNETIEAAATTIGVDPSFLQAISFRFKKAICPQIAEVDPLTHWQLPAAVGNPGAVLTFGFSTTNSALLRSLSKALHGSGLRCVAFGEFDGFENGMRGPVEAGMGLQIHF